MATVGGQADSDSEVILIAGDWVVDEYWCLVRHESDLSSHTGLAHYRLDAEKYEKVMDLCGAGHVARVLYRARQEQTDKSFKLVGIGNWHKDDTHQLTHIIHAGRDGTDCKAGAVTFRLKPESCDVPLQDIDIELHTLRPEGSTARIIRQYQRAGDTLEQINRADWEDPHVDSSMTWPDELDQYGDRVTAIVLHDLEKGAVDDQLIQKLKNFKKAKWYIRAKHSEQDWLKEVARRIELFVVGPEVAARWSPFEHWLVNGMLTRRASDVLDRLPGRNVLLFSERREVVGQVDTEGKEGNACALWGQSQVEPTAMTQIGWASALMAAFVFRMRDDGGNSVPVTPQMLYDALVTADDEGRLPGQLGERGQPRQRPAPFVGHESRDWKVDRQQWGQARKHLGIVTLPTGRNELQVWRACDVVPGYVACVQAKRDILEEVSRRLRVFRRTEASRSLSIMLRADPGAGKTSLARALAEAFDFELVKCDITQLTHREEVLDFFDTIATKQATATTPLLIFVDEINALLENSAVYGMFLAPLEDGVYTRRGQQFSLRPSAWLFAGTKRDEDKNEHRDKVSDFESRLTLIKEIDYDTLASEYQKTDRVSVTAQKRLITHLANPTKLEYVYVGASMISQFFPDVTEVSVKVLEEFYDIDPTRSGPLEPPPFRRIRHLVESLRNVQYGRIHTGNFAKSKNDSPEVGELSSMVRLAFVPELPALYTPTS